MRWGISLAGVIAIVSFAACCWSRPIGDWWFKLTPPDGTSDWRQFAPGHAYERRTARLAGNETRYWLRFNRGTQSHVVAMRAACIAPSYLPISVLSDEPHSAMTVPAGGRAMSGANEVCGLFGYSRIADAS